MKKHFLILAAVFSTAFVPIYSARQQSAATKQATARKQLPVSQRRRRRLSAFPTSMSLRKRSSSITIAPASAAVTRTILTFRPIGPLRFSATHCASHTLEGRAHRKNWPWFSTSTRLRSPTIQEMLKADFAYDSKVFDAWVQSAQAPAISGSLRALQGSPEAGREHLLHYRPA